MGMHVPEWVSRFFLVVTGESWPQADEDQLWAMADAWAAFETNMAAIETEIAELSRVLQSGDWEGDAATAVRGRLAELADSGSLRKLVEAAGKLSRFADGAGTNVEYTKASIIGQLLILTVQIIMLLPWVSFPPTSAWASGWISSLITFGRYMSATFFRRLITSILFGIVLQVGLDVAIQFTQLFITGTRDKWDGKRTGGAALAGAVGGVLGPILSSGFGRIFGQKFVTSIVGFAGIGALHEWSTEALADLILTGRREQNDNEWASASAGAVEGVLDWIGHRGGRNSAGAGLDSGVGDLDIPGLDGNPFDFDPGPDRFDGPAVADGDFTFTGIFPDPKTFIGNITFTGTLNPPGAPPQKSTFTGSGAFQGDFDGAFDRSRLGSRNDMIVGQVTGSGSLAGDFHLSGSFTPVPGAGTVGEHTPPQARPGPGAQPQSSATRPGSAPASPLTSGITVNSPPTPPPTPPTSAGTPSQASPTSAGTPPTPLVAATDATPPAHAPAVFAEPDTSTSATDTDTDTDTDTTPPAHAPAVFTEPDTSTSATALPDDAQHAEAPGRDVVPHPAALGGSPTTGDAKPGGGDRMVVVRDRPVPSAGWHTVPGGFAHPAERVLVTTDGRWQTLPPSMPGTGRPGASLMRADLFGLYFATADDNVLHVPLRADQVTTADTVGASMTATPAPAADAMTARDSTTALDTVIDQTPLTAQTAAALAALAVTDDGKVLFPGPYGGADVAAARWVPTGPGSTRVIVHAQHGLVRVGNSQLTPQQFAQVLSALPPGTLRGTVELISCNTTPTAGTLAGSLAVALDRPVVGATTPVWTAVGPGAPSWARAIAATVDPSGRLRPRLNPDGTPDGRFVRHAPDGAGGLRTENLGATLDPATADAVDVTDDAALLPRQSSPQPAGAISWHQWVSPAGTFGPARNTPALLREPGIIGGQNVPIHDVVDTNGALRAHIVAQLTALAPRGWNQQQLTDAVNAQLPDTELTGRGRSLFDGSGLRVTLGKGRDAIEVRLTAVAGAQSRAAPLRGSDASAAQVSSGTSPDRRTPQRTAVDNTRSESSAGSLTAALGYSAVGMSDVPIPAVRAVPLGSVSVQGTSTTVLSQSAQTRLRTNEEITQPAAGTAATQAQAWQTTAAVTVEVTRRGHGTQTLPGGHLEVTVSALNAMTALPAAPAPGNQQPQSPQRGWLLPPNAVLETTSVPGDLFDSLVNHGQIPPGFRKPGSDHRAALAELTDAQTLGLNRHGLIVPPGQVAPTNAGAPATTGLTTDKITSRRGEDTPAWQRPFTATQRGFTTLTAVAGTPVLMFNPLTLPGRAESAIRAGASGSSSTSHDTTVRLQGTVGVGVSFGEDIADPLHFGTFAASGILGVERGSGSSSSTEFSTQIEAKSKVTGDMLLYRVPLTVYAHDHVGHDASPARQIGTGPAHVYLWVTPLDAHRLGYPGAPVPTPVPAQATAPASPLPPVVGNWQPMALPDVRDIRTTADNGTRLWDRVVATVNAVDPDLLPRQGGTPDRARLRNLQALQNAVTQSHLRGNWRTLLESGIRVSLERPSDIVHDTMRASQHVSIVISAALTSPLTADNALIPGTQIEETTRAGQAHTDGRSVSLGARAGAQAQLGMSTGRASTAASKVRAFFIRFGAVMSWRHQRSLSGGTAPATGHLTKVDRPLRAHSADLAFSVRAEYADRPRTLNAVANPVPGRFHQVTVPGPALTVTNGFRAGLPEFDQVHPLAPAGTPPRVEIVDTAAAPHPGTVSIQGPHQFLDAHVAGDALFTAADIALGEAITREQPGPGPRSARGRVGRLWSGWRSTAGVRSTSGQTYTYESTAVTEPGSPAELAVRNRLTPDAIRSALDVYERGGGPATVLRGGTFTDMVGDLTMTVQLANPRRALTANTGYSIYDSAELTDKTESGRRGESGWDVTAAVQMNSEAAPSSTTDPRGVHRVTAMPQVGHSSRTGERNETENVHGIARREVVENEVSTAMLADLVVTFTGGLSARNVIASSHTPDVTVRVTAPDSLLFLVTEAEAARLVAVANQQPAPAAPAAAPAATRMPPFLRRMLGLGVVHRAVPPHDPVPPPPNSPPGTPPQPSLRDRFADSLPQDVPARIRERAADVAADLITLQRLKPAIDGLYDAGVSDTFTIDGVLYRDEVKVVVQAAASNHRPAAEQVPGALRASLFSSAATGTRWQRFRQRVTGLSVPAFYGGGTRLTTGEGTSTGLQSLPVGLTAAVNKVRHWSRLKAASRNTSGYVEKSGPLTGVDADHAYTVTVTRQRVSTKLGVATVAVGAATHLLERVRRQVWPGTPVVQHNAVTLAVPVTSTDRPPELGGRLGTIGQATPGHDTAPALTHTPGGDGTTAAWALPPGTSYSLEGVVAGAALRDAVTRAFTPAGARTPRLLTDYVTDLVLDRITGGETMLPRVRTMLDGELRSGDLFDDSGLVVRLGGFRVTARLHGRPLLLSTSTTVEQEAQHEVGEIERESGSSGLDVNAGAAGVRGGAVVGGQPDTDAARRAFDWQPNELLGDIAPGSGGRDSASSGDGLSGGTKIKQKNRSWVYGVDLALYVEPDRIDGRLPVVEGRLPVAPASVVVDWGAQLRLWAGDVEAMGMFGWRERLGDPADLTGVAVDPGTHLAVVNGQLHLAPGAGAPVGDITALPSDSGAVLVVDAGVTDAQAAAFVTALATPSRPPAIRADGHTPAQAATLAAATGVPVVVANGVRALAPNPGVTVPAGADRARDPGWPALVEEIRHTPHHNGPVTTAPTSVRPVGAWTRPGHGLTPVPGNPTVFALSAHPGVLVEATASGLWIRPAAEPAADIRTAHDAPAVPAGPVLRVQADTQALRDATDHVLAHLDPDLARQAMVHRPNPPAGTGRLVPAAAWTDRDHLDARHRAAADLDHPGRAGGRTPRQLATAAAATAAAVRDWLTAPAPGQPTPRDVADTAIAAYAAEMRRRRQDWDTAVAALAPQATSARLQAVRDAAARLDPDQPANAALRRLRDTAQAAVDNLAALRDQARGHSQTLAGHQGAVAGIQRQLAAYQQAATAAVDSVTAAVNAGHPPGTPPAQRATDLITEAGTAQAEADRFMATATDLAVQRRAADAAALGHANAHTATAAAMAGVAPVDAAALLSAHHGLLDVADTASRDAYQRTQENLDAATARRDGLNGAQAEQRDTVNQASAAWAAQVTAFTTAAPGHDTARTEVGTTLDGLRDRIRDYDAANLGGSRLTTAGTTTAGLDRVADQLADRLAERDTAWRQLHDALTAANLDVDAVNSALAAVAGARRHVETAAAALTTAVRNVPGWTGQAPGSIAQRNQAVLALSRAADTLDRQARALVDGQPAPALSTTLDALDQARRTLAEITRRLEQAQRDFLAAAERHRGDRRRTALAAWQRALTDLNRLLAPLAR
ncbi:WXG100 family type VII secretion target [Catellatospora paridis]|uniref:WXG100 family type VII secretion target n=1 Tax=Catellatospora paridis TaxID=1617086 RepID=UPI0012D3F4BC|nr:WXG100 family type VII secretion target [Catellatospora paridis]